MPTNSANGSPNSATRAINSCAAALADLEKSRELIAALENENAALVRRLEIEKAASALLAELNETRSSENEALRQTIRAKNETIAAKNDVIDAQKELNRALERKKPSLLKRIGDVLLGAAVIAVLK